MNPQPEEDLKRRLEKLEAMNSSSVLIPQSDKIKTSSQSSPSFYSRLRRFVNWFKNLSGVRKLIVSGVALLLGFAILQAVLKLVAAAISLALLSILVYLGYKFLVSNNSHA
ncbi:hypothetical protein [Mastigocladopsis repens]|uniref:hypothetical protein n=1 Tax=Mastigocladopsis repens TaxID=221287 RepID=UPI0003085D63|nr:hypothetical protein [Mastigocladopsis repens]